MRHRSKWFWIVIIIIAIILFLGFLYSQGLINVKWQWLTVILAAAAAPFTFISKLFSGKSIRTNQILKDHTSRILAEKKHRQIYEQAIKKKEERIKELEAQVATLEDEIDDIQLQHKEVTKKVNKMDDVKDLQDAFMEAYEDES